MHSDPNIQLPGTTMLRAGDTVIVRDDLTGHKDLYIVQTVQDGVPRLRNHVTRHGCNETIFEVRSCSDVEHEAFLRENLGPASGNNRVVLASILSARGEHLEALNTAFLEAGPWEITDSMFRATNGQITVRKGENILQRDFPFLAEFLDMKTNFAGRTPFDAVRSGSGYLTRSKMELTNQLGKDI